MRLDIDLTQGKTQHNVFFTSDFHLFHHNVLKFDNRPFDDVHQMHLAIEKNWNEIVTPNDVVIYLGDLSFARREDKLEVDSLIDRLKGRIHYIMGNHDKFEEIKKNRRFITVQDYIDLRIKFKKEDVVSEVLFCCMHYPIYSWNKKHHGSYQIHGHSHMNLSGDEFHKNNRIFDVGCMGYEYYPISYTKIMELGENIDFKITDNHHKEI